MNRGALLFLMLVGACRSSNSDSNAFDPGSAAGDSDRADTLPADSATGCAANQIPNAYGVCITLCQTTSDCANVELVCNLDLGVCVPKPEPVCDPATCEAGYECPPTGQGSACVPLPEGACNTDRDCTWVERCEVGSCISRVGDVVQTCAADDECPLLMKCQVGVCVGCLDDLQCQLSGNTEAKCVSGACIIADLGTPGECINKECPEGFKCALTTGECAKSCTVDLECGEAERCMPVGKYCVADFGCAATEDCTVPLECLQGLCVGCTDDSQCLASESCVATACFPRLTGPCDGVTCQTAGEICDPQNGSCYPENGTCVDVSDCRTGQSCNFLHLCAGCTVDGDCRANQRCLLSTCLPTSTGGNP